MMTEKSKPLIAIYDENLDRVDALMEKEQRPDRTNAGNMLMKYGGFYLDRLEGKIPAQLPQSA